MLPAGDDQLKMTIIIHWTLLLLLILGGVQNAATADQGIENDTRVLFDSAGSVKGTNTFRTLSALNLIIIGMSILSCSHHR